MAVSGRSPWGRGGGWCLSGVRAQCGAFDSLTGDALSLDGLGDDGEGLVARLVQHLAELLHAVAVNNHRLPPAARHRASDPPALGPGTQDPPGSRDGGNASGGGGSKPPMLPAVMC